jgi:hypothetical protein
MRPLTIVWERLSAEAERDRCAATQHEVEHAVHPRTRPPLGLEPHLDIRELDRTLRWDPAASNL